MELPVDVAGLVPHKKPMLIVDRLLEVEGDDCVAETVFPADSPFISHNNKVDPLILIEFIAQSYASAKGYIDIRDGGKVLVGYLVGVSQTVFYQDVYPGMLLRAEIHSEPTIDNFYLVTGKVYDNQELLAEVVLKIWLVPGE